MDDSVILCEGCGFGYEMNGPMEEAVTAWNLRADLPDEKYVSGKPISEAVKMGCDGLLGPTVKIFAMELRRLRPPTPKLELPQEVKNVMESARIEADFRARHGKTKDAAIDGLWDYILTLDAFIRRIAGEGA